MAGFPRRGLLFSKIEMASFQAPLLDVFISEKIERRAPLRRRVIIFGKITVIIVLSTEELKSILFEDHDRIPNMPWLCHPNSHPVQVFCTLYCRSSDFKDALPVPS